MAGLGQALPHPRLRRAGQGDRPAPADLQVALTQGLSNGRVEAVNAKIRLLIRVTFGFKSPEALIALAMLSLGGLCPSLPGRG